MNSGYRMVFGALIVPILGLCGGSGPDSSVVVNTGPLVVTDLPLVSISNPTRANSLSALPILDTLPIALRGLCDNTLAVDITLDGQTADPPSYTELVVNKWETTFDCFGERTRYEAGLMVDPGRHEVRARVVNADGASEDVVFFIYDPALEMVIEVDPPRIEAPIGQRSESRTRVSQLNPAPIAFEEVSPDFLDVDPRGDDGFGVVFVTPAADAPPGTYPVTITAVADNGPMASTTLEVVVPGVAETIPPPPVQVLDLSGKWAFTIDVQRVEGTCGDEDPYTRDVDILQAGTSLSVVGLGTGSQAWEGMVDPVTGDVIFGGTRDESEGGTTTAEFVLTVNGVGDRFSGEELWSWEEKPGSGDCWDGVSDVKASRVP